MSYKSKIEELYKDISKEVLNKIIEELDAANIMNISESNFLNYLNINTVKEFISNLNENNISNINIDNIKKAVVNGLLGESNESEKYTNNIKSILNNKHNIEYLENNINIYLLNLNIQSIKNLFSNLNENNIRNISFNQPIQNQNLVKLLESMEYNNNFKAIEKILNSKSIKIINLSILEKLKTKNGIKNFLLYLPKDKFEEINLNNINNAIINELFNDKDFLEKINLSDYLKIQNIFGILDLENTKKLLSNISNSDIAYIEFNNIFKNFIELMEESKTNNKLFENLKLLCYYPSNKKYCFLLKELNNKKINDFLSKLNLDEEIKKFSYNNFKTSEISDFIEKTKDISFAKKYFSEIDNVKISEWQICDFSTDFLAELITNLNENDPIFKKIMLINFDNKDCLNKLLDKINEKNIIKLINNIDVHLLTIINKKISEKRGRLDNANFYIKKRFTKELILHSKEITKELSRPLSDSDYNILKEIMEELKDEEIAKVNLSNVYDSKKLRKFINEMIKNNKKLPQFDISIISKSLLFSAIKEKKIKNANIAEKSKSNLVFLKDAKKFSIIQKIIIENNLFIENPEIGTIEYNKKILEELVSELNSREIIIFVKFYCENSKNIEFFKEEKLKEELRNINAKGITTTKMIFNDFFNPNKNLRTEKNPDGYIKNRQRNKNLLFRVLSEKIKKRIKRIEKLKKMENRKIFFETNYNNKNRLANEKEEIEYIIKQYHYETLRRAIIDYNRRIEPFVKKHFELNEANEITKNIEDALGILFHPDSSNTFKLEAQKKFKDNIDKIGKKYEDFVGEGVKISGSHLMLSSICNAENINDLNKALYSHIRIKMVNDYTIKHSFEENDKNKKTLLEINTDKLYRAYSNLTKQRLEEALYNFTCNPIPQIGRKEYKTFDMITKEENIKNANPVNILCSVAGNSANTHNSNAGAYTSLSSKSQSIIEDYAPSILSVYAPMKNSKKSFFTNVANKDANEVIAFDMLPEDIIMNIVPENNKIKVVFNKNMNFVTFKLRKKIEINKKVYEAGKNISQDDLENIICEKFSLIKDVADFLDNNLIIEKSFDKNKILGEKEEIKKENEEEKAKKTFEIEKKINSIIEMTESKIYPFYEKETATEEYDKDVNTYIIPDVHGKFNELLKDLEEIGLITVEKDKFVWYSIDDSGFEIPIHKIPENYEANKDKYIQLPKITINKNFNGKVIQLGDLVDSHKGKNESKECLAISILLSKQVGEKYTTLVGNHEIAKLCNNKYKMDEDNVNYEVPVIKEAIINGTIKLFHHTHKTNIISSHVPLFKDNIINFLNNTVIKHNDIYEYYNEKINRLSEIIGAEKVKGKYEIDNNKCLLDKIPPKEKDIEDFVDILNELFIITFKENLKEGLLETLVNDNRLYKDENGAMKLMNVSYKELSKHTFKGIDNYVGHDATPIGLRDGYPDKCQEEVYKLLRILFTDEWQGEELGAKFVKIKTNEKGENKIYFYKEKIEEIKKDKGQENKNVVFELYGFDGKEIEKVEENNNSFEEKQNKGEDGKNLYKGIDDLLFLLNNNVQKLTVNNLEDAIDGTNNIKEALEQDESQILIK